MRVRWEFLILFTACLHAQFVSTHGKLHVEGTRLLDSTNRPIVLRGMSFGWHSFWPQYYNPDAVAWLKQDFHCTVVRAAMGIEVGNRTYLEDPEFAVDKIKAVIEGAIKSDIYVVVDWHSHNINLPQAMDFFDQISREYGHLPNIIYEIFNEPDQESWREVKAYSEKVIATIRKNDPHNIILVGCPHWDQDILLPASDPIIGFQNLMYTVHFYAATHGKWLRDNTDKALRAGLPVFISESAGMEASGDGPINEKAWQEYIDWMEARGLSWITWSVSDKDESCSILRAGASPYGKWRQKDLKKSGRLIRQYLRSFSGN